MNGRHIVRRYLPRNIIGITSRRVLHRFLNTGRFSILHEAGICYDTLAAELYVRRQLTQFLQARA